MKAHRRHRHTVPLVFIFTIVWGIFLAAMPCNSADLPQQPTEYQVKAAFLFNFAKFVTWPIDALASSDTVLIIGVIGNNKFIDDLKSVIGEKRVQNRRIEIRHYRWYKDIDYCHILFVDCSERPRLRRILRHIGSRPILTVGDGINNFCQAGGIINFVMNDTMVNFEINPASAKVHGLQISSKLLRLATIIQPKKEGRK